MKRGLSLRARTALLIAGILLVSATTTMIVVRAFAKARIETDKVAEVVLRQSQFDEALVTIVNRVTGGYLYLFDDPSELTAYFGDTGRTEDERIAFFEAMLAASEIDRDTFGEVLLHVGGTFYAGGLAAAEVSHPDAAFLAAVLAGPAGELAYAGVYDDAAGDGYLVFARTVETLYPDSERFGVALFYVRPAAVDAALAALTWPEETRSAWSFIRAGGHVAATTGTAAGTEAIAVQPTTDGDFVVVTTDGVEAIVVARRLDALETTYPALAWDVVTVIDRALLFSAIDALNRYILVLGALALATLALLSARIAGGVTKPLRRLVDNLREFGKTQRKTAAVVAGDEIVELERTYDAMIDQIIDLLRTNAQETENKRKLELYALQMQINPHFLYNTLDAIAWMAKIKKEPEIEKLVLALARFFRISLHKGDKYIAVAEEIDLVRHFVEIQAIRFPGLFEVVYDVDPAVADVETLKLILQPIVENAIKHGFAGLDRVGHLVISVRGRDDDVVFTVADDGIGFEPTEDLFSEKRLLGGLGGYGLKNVDERIKLEYGRAYGITVASSTGGGTTVTVRIGKTRR